MIRRLLLAVGAILLLSAVAGLPAEAAGTVHGCPHGAVCVYPQNAGWNRDRPSLFFYSYGSHNLSNQVGHHYVLNNQYDVCSTCGWAVASGRTGYNGGGSEAWRLVPWDHQPFRGAAWDNVDLSPINSIYLWVIGP